MKVIPLQYLSGLAYSQVQADCTAPMQVGRILISQNEFLGLFPGGRLHPDDLLDRRRKQYEDPSLRCPKQRSRVLPVHARHHLHVGLVRDSQTWVSFIRRDKFDYSACDSNWTEFGQYCTYFESQKMTWNDAQNFCAQAGGFLVDDLSEDTHRFLQNVANSNSYWMGLHNFGNGYVWDRGNNNATTVSSLSLMD